MKTLLMHSLILFGFLFTTPAFAALKVFACEPEWAALVQELADNKAEIFTATAPTQDPHHIEARPSLIARVRQADLMVCTGAELEVGWVPMLQRQAGNPKVQPGTPGFFEAAMFVERLEQSAALDRALGDVHASGNPHVQVDPRRIEQIAPKLSARLIALDPANAEHYRNRLADFSVRWTEALRRWTTRAAALKGKRVVAHHNDWSYLYEWLGLRGVGMLEPKPGVPPSARHLAELKARLAREPADVIILTVYQDRRPAQWLSEQTGTRVAVLPHTVGATPEAKNLYALYDDIIARLSGDAK